MASHLRKDDPSSEKTEVFNSVKNTKPDEIRREIVKRLGIGQTMQRKWLKEKIELPTEQKAVQQSSMLLID